MSTLLVIDDEAPIQDCLRVGLSEPGMQIWSAGTVAAGVDLFRDRHPDIVLLDVNLPDQSGLAAFRQIHDIDSRVPIILMTGSGTTETAIQAMALGAYEYLLKPLVLGEVRLLVRRAIRDGELMRVAVLEEDAPNEVADVLVGRSGMMQEVYKAVGRVAPRDMTVLILGESGTGKELVARAIYQHSQRAAAPFLAINCAAIPENLLESELFGHEKGAFTGADRKRIGKFEQCAGGTLFLDEVGDMTPLTQTKILRVLQEQRFERVGGNETIQTDVRVIAATNRNLEEMVAAGRFRGDLYYRLNVFTIHLPPLRQHLEDLPVLIGHFRRRFCRELDKEVRSVAPEALSRLCNYSWPGNIRELQSVLKQALLHACGPVLTTEFLPEFVRWEPTPNSPPAIDRASLDQFVTDRLRAGSTDLHNEWLGATERHLFERVLAHTKGNLSQAARVLGIHRSTLRTKLSALGMQTNGFASDTPEPDE